MGIERERVAPNALCSGRRELFAANTKRSRVPLRVAQFRAAFLFAFTLIAPALAHPFHASVAEVDYRRETGKLEIAIRMFTDDAETMLTKRAGKKITFTHTPAAELDALLLAAVRESFTVRAPDGAPKALTWVGRELRDREQHVWVYVECTLPDGIAGAQLAHRLLHDTFSDQLNSIKLRDRGPPLRQVTLFFQAHTKPAVVFGRK